MSLYTACSQCGVNTDVYISNLKNKYFSDIFFCKKRCEDDYKLSYPYFQPVHMDELSHDNYDFNTGVLRCIHCQAVLNYKLFQDKMYVLSNLYVTDTMDGLMIVCCNKKDILQVENLGFYPMCAYCNGPVPHKRDKDYFYFGSNIICEDSLVWCGKNCYGNYIKMDQVLEDIQNNYFL